LTGAGNPPWDEIGQWQSSKPTWSKDNDSFLHLKYENGHYQLWRTFVAAPRSVPIFRRNRDVRSFCWGPDQHSAVVEVGPVDTERTTAFRKLVREGVVYDYSFNESIAPLETEQDLGPQLPSASTYFVVDSNGRPIRNANKEDVDYLKNHLSTPYQQQKASPDGTVIASIEDIPGPSGDRFNSFAIFVRKNGSDPRQVTSTFRTITQLWWTSSSKEVVFVAGNNGESGIFKVDIEEPKTQVIRGPKGEETFYQCTADSKTTHLACTLETPDSPAEAAVISMHGGRLQVLTDANPEYNRLIRSAAKKYEWTNRYGDSAFGYLFLPVNYVKGTRYPLIITTYRAWGFMRGGVGDEYPVQVLAANGFAVFVWERTRNYEPATGHSQEFESTLKDWQSPVASLQQITESLDNAGIIDNSKIGITGLSWGAGLALYAISHVHLFSAASVSNPGVTDPMFYYIGGTVWREQFARWGLPGLPTGPSADKWRKWSTALNSDQITAPLLIQASNMEYFASLQLVTTLKMMNKPVELIIYPGESHIKKEPVHKLELYTRNVDWFRFWFQDHEDPDPAKAEQYVRWRELRRLQEKNKAGAKPN